MSFLVTGASGALGSALCSYFKEALPLYRHDFDLTDLHETKNFIHQRNPKVVIHTAAMTNVEECEKDIDACYKINTLGTYNLLESIKGQGTKFIYISSTGLYGASKSQPYTEFDQPLPTTVHHHSKYEAEKLIQTLHNNHLILRTGWLFGAGIHQTKNFVVNRYKEALNHAHLTSDNIQKGNPTFILDVIKQLEIMINHDLRGTFNVVNQGHASRYEYVKAIIDNFALSAEVQPGEAFKRIAPVSNNEMATNYKLHLLGLDQMPHWTKSLTTYIQTIKKEIES